LLTKNHYIYFPDIVKLLITNKPMNNKIKFFICAILPIWLVSINAFAQEAAEKRVILSGEYKGYALFDAVNNKGEKLFVQKPVKYKIYFPPSPKDNDENYRYRSYKIERDSHKQEDTAHNPDEETKNINSAAYYPIYFD